MTNPTLDCAFESNMDPHDDMEILSDADLTEEEKKVWVAEFEMFQFAPMAAYRQPPNIRRLICKSKHHPISNGKKLVRGAHKNAAGWKKCGHNCKICPYTLNNTHTIKGLA